MKPVSAWIWIASLTVFGLVGCNEHPLIPLDQALTGARTEAHAVPGRLKVDFLFVIDDSGSMCQEQAALARNFRAFSDALIEDVGSALDVRIAVTSTDLADVEARGRLLARPAPPVVIPGDACADPVTGEPFVPDTADCPADLEAVLSLNVDSDPAQVARDFRCLVNLGASGSSFERGLEAMRLALSCHGPNSALLGECCVPDAEAPTGVRYDPFCKPAEGLPAPRFLRPDAVLAVVFVTDEDDCSAPGDHPELTGCLDEACKVPTTSVDACTLFADRLSPVNDYFDFLFRLKAQPERQILVASFAGVPIIEPDGRMRRWARQNMALYNRCDPLGSDYDPTLSDEICCPGGVCQRAPEMVCSSDEGGDARSGVRYQALAQAFGPNGIGCPEGLNSGADCVSICDGSLTRPLERLGRQIVQLQSWCLDKVPSCLSETGAVVACPPEDGRYALRVRLDCKEESEGCGSGALQTMDQSRWSVVVDDTCSGTGLAVNLTDLAPPGARLSIEYLVGGMEPTGGR